MEEILSKVVLENLQTNKRPSLLLHACCGPCSSYVLELLASVFDITVYYYNPNIHPEQEYCRRLEELKKFLKKFPPALENKVKLVTDTYNPEEYFGAVGIEKEPELKNEPEKGERCRRCYSFRMKRSWDYACSNGFQWFTTTLSSSRWKDRCRCRPSCCCGTRRCGRNGRKSSSDPSSQFPFRCPQSPPAQNLRHHADGC